MTLYPTLSVEVVFVLDQNHNEMVTEEYLNLPLCQSECDDWWNACRDEYTCADNWYNGFDTSHPGEIIMVNCWQIQRGKRTQNMKVDETEGEKKE